MPRLPAAQRTRPPSAAVRKICSRNAVYGVVIASLTPKQSPTNEQRHHPVYLHEVSQPATCTPHENGQEAQTKTRGTATVPNTDTNKRVTRQRRWYPTMNDTASSPVYDSHTRALAQKAKYCYSLPLVFSRNKSPPLAFLVFLSGIVLPLAPRFIFFLIL